MPKFFTVNASDGTARAGTMMLNGVEVPTPYFQPVATRGMVKDGSFDLLEQFGYPHVLMNTYHLLCRPGLDTIKQLGGLRKFTGWRGSILTDSGGFQVMSLSPLRKVTFEGVKFRDYESGKPFFLTPEGAVDAQLGFKSDIAMMLDVCSQLPSTRKQVEADMAITHNWARRAYEHWRTLGGARTKTRLFGIVQGGIDLELRAASIEAICSLLFPGIAIGGLAVGETREEFLNTAKFCIERLPQDRPRYLLGLGTPEDIALSVEMGYDFFDCVLPTRMARRGVAYTWEGVLNLKLKKFAGEALPLSPSCKCPICQRHSRAFLRHLIAADEVTAAVLMTQHNLFFYRELVLKLRGSVLAGKLQPFLKKRLGGLSRKL
jgi:queuine tRNA-ribosyltransferase